MNTKEMRAKDSDALTKEVDALEVMSIDPVYYLVMPRLVALSVASVVLTIYADAIGVLGGALVAKSRFHVDVGIFLQKNCGTTCEAGTFT